MSGEPVALEVVQPEAALAAPLPIFRGAQMAQAFVAYQELQRALDAAMPDQLMQLDGKPFRKKGYWRAVAVAFNLKVVVESERREVAQMFDDGRENFGYVVTYSATAQNGHAVTGDGSCFAVEKARRFKCQHPHPRGWKGKSEHWPPESCPDFDPAFQWRALPAQASEHNIRSHAHTRAFNRAVSNLVGFGEVSAEEAERDEYQPPPEDFVIEAEPDAPPRVRLTLPEGAHEILATRKLKYGGEVKAVDHAGVETLYSVPDGRCVVVAEQLYQEHVPVTFDRVRTRDGSPKLKGVHRYKTPEQIENERLDAEIAAKEAAKQAEVL